MHRPTWAATLLSLGTSYDEANAIEGDLIEESRARGRLWFGAQAVAVSTRLFCRALLLAAPAQTLLAGYAIYELAIKLQWWGVVRVRRFLRYDAGLPEAVIMSATLAMWTLCGLVIGFLLVRLLPALGLRVAVVALLLLNLRLVLLDSQVSLALLMAFGAIPLLCACLLAHRRNLAQLPAPMPGA